MGSRERSRSRSRKHKSRKEQKEKKSKHSGKNKHFRSRSRSNSQGLKYESWGRDRRGPRPDRQERKDEKPSQPKQMPCWQPSGILLQFYNQRDGISLKFHEPPQSRPPNDSWRMYTFKGQEVLNPITLQKSCYLVGKDERICDILCQNPSISRQHAVIQFRLINKISTEGQYTEIIKPYLIDLGSTNGTLLNEEKISPERYYQLIHKDVVKFGFSEREYVIVHDPTVAIERGEQGIE